MCSSAGGWQKRDGGGNSEGKATGFRFHYGCDCHSGLKEKGPQSRITLKCHVSCLWVHVFVFTLCSGRISTQWGATVRRIFQHLEVLLLGALYECFPPWISSAWSCFLLWAPSLLSFSWPLCTVDPCETHAHLIADLWFPGFHVIALTLFHVIIALLASHLWSRLYFAATFTSAHSFISG